MPDLRPSLSQPLATILALAGVLGIGTIDFLTGFDVSLSFFYALPVIWSVWLVGRGTGGGVALLSALAWAMADKYSGHHYSSQWILVWNAGVRFCFLLLIVTGTYYTRKQVAQNQARSVILERTLPVCTCCKKIRDEEGAWLDVETYVMEHLSAHPTQKLCPDCAKRVYIQQVSPNAPPHAPA
jgi:hypothetical protein